jgi:L-ascorbate metabolism protein UlaG (beta-lactamase superfamily)
MRITMIGHSSVLLESNGQRILTDPWFGTWGNLAYARTAPASVKADELRNVDVVLISHHHWDHMDTRFVRSLPSTTTVMTSAASAVMCRARNATTLEKWQTTSAGAFNITAVPAIHLAFAPLGFVIEAEGRAIYFAGDTYFGDFMNRIGSQFALDVALMPVTSFRIKPTMGEDGALRAAEALRARTIIPIHLGISPRSPLLRSKETPERFSDRLKAKGVNSEVRVLREGESFEL